jgi:hypothetical protein
MNIQQAIFNLQNPNRKSDAARSIEHRLRMLILALFSIAPPAFAQTTTLYTKPVAGAAGGISGRVDQTLTHALALNRDRVQCFRAELLDGGKMFRFPGLPTGKYDLVLISKSDVIYEGLELGRDAEKLTGTPKKNLELRVTKSDTFFNKAIIHRVGLSEDGNKILALIERVRDKLILKQSGEQLKSNLRRIEVADFLKATDDWTLTESRHLYREEAPQGEGMSFCKHRLLPELGNVRVIDSVKDLGAIALPLP